jgi:Leu/Phe-tRNA-protein transferase
LVLLLLVQALLKYQLSVAQTQREVVGACSALQKVQASEWVLPPAVEQYLYQAATEHTIEVVCARCKYYTNFAGAHTLAGKAH